MGDYIVMEGDKALFDQTFGDAVVVVQPGTMIATGPTTINGKKICVKGDESKVMVQGCTYTTALYPGAGVGILKIVGLAGDQVAEKTNSGGKKMLLVGSKFTAEFEVTGFATNSAGKTDSTKKYSGTGSFSTTNRLFTGT